jgi:ADP-ribose pyrophosphatase YjhB (NUDIX family)
MITFDRDGARFTYRTVGVCVEDYYALLHRAEPDDFWSLPGGRVEIGEESAPVLRRELREELGAEAEVGRLL